MKTKSWIKGVLFAMLSSASVGHAQTTEALESPPVEATMNRAVGVGVDFGVSIDVLGIANTISGAVKSAQNRDGWVKNVMETSFYASGQRYNVMVFNLSQEYDDRLQGVQFYGSAVYDGITFGIWVFESGTFHNKGDGGWINWAFRGWFERNGGYVAFRKP